MPGDPSTVRVCASCGAVWSQRVCPICQALQSTLIPQATADEYAARYKELVEAGETARAARAAMSRDQRAAEDAETNRLMFGG